MSKLQILITGPDTNQAADELAALLGADVPDGEILRTKIDPSSEADQKVIDPATAGLAISGIGLLLSIPSFILAMMDVGNRLNERREKRAKAKKVIEAAQHLRLERKTEVLVVTLEGGQRPLDQLDPDQLLDLADRIGKVLEG